MTLRLDKTIDSKECCQVKIVAGEVIKFTDRDMALFFIRLQTHSINVIQMKNFKVTLGQFHGHAHLIIYDKNFEPVYKINRMYHISAF